jgi:type I restriction enzyme S subunit
MIPLGQIAEFRNGVNFVASQRGPGIPVLNVKDFQDRSQPDYTELEQLIPSAVRPESFLQTGDILFVRSNGNKELMGRSMYLGVNPPCPTTHSAFTIRMRLTGCDVEPRYCAYFVRSGIVRQRLSAQGSGTNISNLNQNILSHVEIWLPSLDVQCRIVSILSAYDDLIEVNTRRIGILEEMARRLFDEWFIKFRFPGHETAVVNKDQIGLLPEQWRRSSLNNVSELAGSSINPSATPDRVFTHYSIPSFDQGRLPVIEKGNLILSNKLNFTSPVVLISKLNPRIPRVWRVQNVPEGGAICSAEFLPLKPKSGVGTGWLTGLCTSDAFMGLVKGIAQGTSTSHQRARSQDVLRLPIIIPPPPLQKRADIILGHNFDLVTALLNANYTARCS